jgi:signal transduction histidine kinase
VIFFPTAYAESKVLCGRIIVRPESMRWRLRYQLLVPLLVLVLGVAGVGWWQASAAATYAHEAIEKRVRSVASNYVGEDSNNYPLDRQILLQMKRLSGADYVLVPREGPSWTTLETPPETLPPADQVGDNWQTLQLGPPILVGGTRYLSSGIRLSRPPRKGEILYILYPESLLRDALREAIQPVVILGGFAGLAAVGVALGLGARLGRRIHELERQTRRIAAGDFSPMPVPGHNDEIRDLTVSINEMAQRLAQFQETALKTERLRLLGQVGGGLAHQLRNGLAGAKLALQLFLRESDGQVDCSALDVALRQLTLQESHLQRFLQLGRAESPRREPVALTEVIEQALALVEPRCRHAGIQLEWCDPGPSPIVQGDGGQLGQVLLNLLGNAIDAAGSDGTVAVRLNVSGGRVVLDVLDTGPGPSPEVAARLFEPFATGKPEGIGLGLAVARQVIEAHGGRIGWSREGDRTCFRIELPESNEARP